MTTPTREQVSAQLHEQIPLVASMGVDVAEIDAAHVRLTAPLRPNINHRETAFGGSIATIAILAPWTMLWYRLQAAGLTPRLVVWKSQFAFDRPIEHDFECVCNAPADEDWNRFLKILDRAGRARIDMASKVCCRGVTCATHQGAYVAIQSPPKLA